MQLFLGTLVSSLTGIFPTSVKSIISKIISADEVGKTFALITVVENIANLTGSLALLGFYSLALGIWNRSTFALSALVYLTMICSMIFSSHDINMLAEEDEVLPNVKDAKEDVSGN